MRVGFVYERKEWFDFRPGEPDDLNSELLSREEEDELIEGLQQAGHEVVCIGDVSRLLDGIQQWKQSCDIIFNRSVGYRGVERKSIAAAVLEAAGLPYVGSTPYVLSLTRNKQHCKLIAQNAGLCTPSSAVLFGGVEDRADEVTYPAIIKPLAESSSIGIFSEFPPQIARHRGDFAGKTVVSFCTGGIRCEKAAIHMKQIGIERVYQLEGGILKYFEEVGGAHYHGDCFVFDEREALSADLQPAAGRLHR